MENSLELSRIVSQSDPGSETKKKGPSLQTLLEEFNRMEEFAKPKTKRAKKPSKTAITVSENKLVQGLQSKLDVQPRGKFIEVNLKPKPSSLRGLSHDDGKRTLSSYIGTSLKAITNSPQEHPRKSTILVVNQNDSKPKLTLKPIELSKYADETQEPSLLPRYHVKNESRATKHSSVPSLLEVNPGEFIPQMSKRMTQLNIHTKSSSSGLALPLESLTSRDNYSLRGNLQPFSLDSSPRGRPLIESFSTRQSTNPLLPMSNDYLLKIILNKNEKTISNNGSPRKLQAFNSHHQDYQFAKRGSFAVFKTLIENETYRK